MSMGKKLVAEFIGTAWLVFGGCGSAVFAAAFTSGPPDNIHFGIGFTGVAFAFGLTNHLANSGEISPKEGNVWSENLITSGKRDKTWSAGWTN